MALNLSTLTNPATSGDILQEVNTTADFLESCPVLRNLSRSSNRGSDAKQSVSLNQPRALPLIKNPSGNLGGYLYIPDVSGNYATGPSVTIGSNQTWEAEVDMVITQFASFIQPMGGGPYFTGFGLLLYSDGSMRLYSKHWAAQQSITGISINKPFNLKYGYDGTDLYANIDGNRVYTTVAPSQSSSITHTLEIAQQALTHAGNYAIQKAKLTVNNAVVFDCDFNGSTSIRHGDTKFQASVGGPVSLTRAGQDPITVVKKNILRFDGVNDGLQGLFANNINSGYMFAAFSVLGDGGEAWGRVFSTNSSSGGEDDREPGAAFSIRSGSTTDLHTRFKLATASLVHVAMFDDGNGDFIHESKIQNGSQTSKVNNANLKTESHTITTASDKFNIGSYLNPSLANTAIDLEYLALFSADSVPDEATASKIRDYINGRGANPIYLRHQTDGYYFFDPQKATFTGNFTDANTLDGYITGSDLGDTDVRSNLTLVQATQNDQPSTDGYTITFNDAAEHLEFENSASQNLSGWQIVGTSLGTFAYRVDNDAVTEINLLGNLGNASHRKAGDLYGVILLPSSATGADIEAARRLLIDRGAAESATASNYYASWYGRVDIVEFGQSDTSNITAIGYAWFGCNNMTKFPPLDLSSCVDFDSAWRFAGSLSSFPAGAKLGTAANNVNFTSAWNSSGLTSFPALDLSAGNNFNFAFHGCSALTSFPSGAKLGTSSNNVQFLDTWKLSGLTSFPADIDLSKGTYFRSAWRQSALTSFPAIESLKNGANFSNSWLSCTSLTDFAAVFTNWNPESIASGVFDGAWGGCSALSSQSVENILTSIDASNQHGTDDGTSTGNPLGDSGIDIDYNVATGSLSVATNSAVDSLKAKGWSIIVNNVTL